MSRSSIRYNSSATRSSRYDQRSPSLVGGMFDGVHVARFGVEDKVQQRGEVHSCDDGNRWLFALNSARGHGATPRRQVRENHGGARLRKNILDQRLHALCRKVAIRDADEDI